jgi:hypothetical protein
MPERSFLVDGREPLGPSDGRELSRDEWLEEFARSSSWSFRCLQFLDELSHSLRQLSREGVLSVPDVSGFHHQLGIIRTRVEVAQSQHQRSKGSPGTPAVPMISSP